jgi:tetratricopeptide (TPR) repeat protein
MQTPTTYGFAYLLPQGKFEEAVQEMKRALELDPLSLIINANIGATYLHMRRYDLAVEQCKKTLEINTQFGPVHSNLGRAFEQKGMYEERERRELRSPFPTKRWPYRFPHAHVNGGKIPRRYKTVSRKVVELIENLQCFGLFAG